MAINTDPNAFRLNTQNDGTGAALVAAGGPLQVDADLSPVEVGKLDTIILLLADIRRELMLKNDLMIPEMVLGADVAQLRTGEEYANPY